MRELKKELWPFKISVPGPGYAMHNVEIWLGDNFGAFKGRWNVVYRAQISDYYFRNEKDAVFFALRWT